MLVNGTIPMSSYTVTWSMAIDQSNNIYIGMTGTGTGTPAVIHKISPSGTQLWTTSGVSLGSGYDVKILPLSNGNVVVSYLPGSGTQGSFTMLNSSGSPVWTSQKSLVPVNSGYRTWNGEMVEISGSKFEMVYYEIPSFAPQGFPYAVCYDFNGNAVWSTPVALTSGITTQSNIRHSICQYQDTVYFGFAGSSSSNIQGYIQRINPNGALPWGVGGVDFANQSTDMERVVSIATDEYSNGIWAIAEFTQSNQANVGEYVQKIDRQTGAKLLGANATVVFPVGTANRSHKGQLKLNNGLPYFLITDGISNGVTPVDIVLVQLDATGSLIPNNPLIDMATNTTGVKGRISFVDIWQNTAVAVWNEDRTGSLLPYAQSVSVVPCLPPSAGFFGTPSGLNVDFTQTGSKADSVYWDFGDGTNASDTSLIVSHLYATTGEYTVCQKLFSACGVDSICNTVIACDSVQALILYNPLIDSAEFTALGSTVGDSIYWDFGDGQTLSTTQLTVRHYYSQGGFYYVTLYTSNICSEDSATTEIPWKYESIDENTGSEVGMQLWPNPATDQLHVQLASPTSQIFEIYTLAGQLIRTQEISPDTSSSEAVISVSNLPAGTYILKSSSGDMRATFTITR